MSTELALVNQDDLNELAALMGANQEDLSGGGGGFLPQFKVWTEDDSEEDGAPRLKGKLYITDQDETVFAKPNTVKFRPLSQTFQWTQYNKDLEAMVNKTILVYSFKEEALDEKGTIKCGKPPSKDLKDNKALQEQYKDITTFRRLQGLVSYVGVTKDGEERTVTDVLVSINSKGASFSAFDEEYIKKMPAKANLWDFETSITLSKEKNGTVTYWVMHYTPDFVNKLPFTLPIYETVSGLKDKIDSQNKAIRKKYYDAVAAKNTDQGAIDALKNVGGSSTGSGFQRPGKGSSALDNDFSDDIPF